MIDDLMKRLKSFRYRFTSENELQEGLHAVLSSITETIREYRLDEHDRPDFFLPEHGLAIEVKTKGSAKAVLEQVLRYSEHDQVRAILVVSSRVQASTLPAKINGKPLHSLALTGSALL